MLRRVLFTVIRCLVSLSGLRDSQTLKTVSQLRIRCIVHAFVKKFMGRVIRDGQCVALFREYTEGYLGLPKLERLGANGGAFGLFTRYNSDVGPVTRKHFERIEYKAGMIPLPGDIVIFRGTQGNNGFGHVGVTVEADESTVHLFDQDGISAMNGNAGGAKITRYGYDHVLGWLRQREKAA